MKIRLILLALLSLLLLVLPLTACTTDDTEHLIGRWRMTSYITDNGNQAVIENELDMIFYSTGIGEAQIDGETLYMFNYTAKGGTLHRIITHSSTNVSKVEEQYKFSNEKQTITVYAPDEGATITMQKITSDVKVPIHIK